VSAYKIKKYKFDFESAKKRLLEQVRDDVNWEPATARTPGAVWCDVSKFLDEGIRQQLAQSVGRELQEVFWLCDYRDCKSLEIHRDNPGNEYSIDSRFTIIMMIEGHFEMSIWEDDQTTLIDKAVIGPGEFIILNFCQYYHSGRVLDHGKLSLHAYAKVPEVDGKAPLPHRLDVGVYF